MPKRTDIASILILGAGPIVIGQACEFDYSGAQACKALKADGYRVILVNSNPATIMTDPELAHATYGVLERYSVEMIGADADVIEKAECRQRFREAMQRIDIECPRGELVDSVDGALAALERVGLPAIIRPSATASVIRQVPRRRTRSRRRRNSARQY
jgi:carbamoyl-phosphate synthase large subunit